MNPHELIESMESDIANWRELTGEMVATLEVNIQRGFLTTNDGPAAWQRFLTMLRGWNNRYQRLAASAANLGDVTFRGGVEKSDANEGRLRREA